jgi:hypothetical protein
MELRDPTPKRCARSDQNSPATKPKRSNGTNQKMRTKALRRPEKWGKQAKISLPEA